MYCEVALEGEGKKGREGGGGSCCVGGGGEWRFPGWKETAKYICESGSRGGIVVVQCNYCQEGATLLLLRTRGVGPVQAR